MLLSFLRQYGIFMNGNILFSNVEYLWLYICVYVYVCVQFIIIENRKFKND